MKLDIKGIRPLLSIARHDPDRRVGMAALDAAARFDLSSKAKSTIKREVLKMTGRPEDPDAVDLDTLLDPRKDPRQLDSILEEARAGRWDAFERLALMPLQKVGIDEEAIPPLPEGASSDALLWRALALAKVGTLGPINEILEGRHGELETFYGSPWVAYDRIAAVRPIPDTMHEHLIGKLSTLDTMKHEIQRMGRLIIWAATGIADAEGDPIEKEAPRQPDRPPSPIPPDQVAGHVMTIITEANRKAEQLPVGAPAEVVVGNQVLQDVLDLPVTDDWPVLDIARAQLAPGPKALDDAQAAWVIARAAPDRVVREMVGGLLPAASRGERLRILSLIAEAGNVHSRRAGSPFRGSGPVSRPLLTHFEEDEPRRAMASRDADPPPPPPPPSPEEGEEGRRVNVKIRHGNKDRMTFVAGAVNVIRCWIGLPAEGAAVADRPVPHLPIPEEGLPLDVVLEWGGQTARGKVILPPDRTARTGDCDLKIDVPRETRFVEARIAFLYRGSAFEVVVVEAAALAADEQPRDRDLLRVKVLMEQRHVVDIQDRKNVDSLMIFGGGSVHEFNWDSARRYDLADANQAVKYLNDEVFAAETTLVRRRARAGGTEDVLDIDDDDVRKIFRTLAAHGSTIYNSLQAQGFVDCGDRIQILNTEPSEYVPAEFAYDRGYPAVDATICEEGLTAMQQDDPDCPVCPSRPRPDPHTICPYGFWTIRKVIERHDPGVADAGLPLQSVPLSERRVLTPIDRILFASSDKVPVEEREKTWQAIQERYAGAVLAHDWNEWRDTLRAAPVPLLLALPHHDLNDIREDYLEIGDETVPVESRRLNRGQITFDCVNPNKVDPGPIVMLLGCRTGTGTEEGYVAVARSLQRLRSSIVMGTLAKILGRHAAPVAREMIEQLAAVHDPEADFGTIMRRLRRKMLARGYLMALCIVALGDAEWRLGPAPPRG